MATNYLQTKCNELTDIIRFKRPNKQQVEHIIKWLNIYCGHIFCDTLIDYLIYWGYPIEAQISDYGVITKYYLKNEQKKGGKNNNVCDNLRNRSINEHLRHNVRRF